MTVEHSPDRQQLAHWLKRRRRDFAWLAEQVAVSRSYLSLMLSGKRPMVADVRDEIHLLTGIWVRKPERVQRTKRQSPATVESPVQGA
jgi:hypothetical protein